MRAAIVAALLAACGPDNVDPPIPTCDEAMAHYYSVGCIFFVNAQPTLEPDAAQYCRQDSAEGLGCEVEWEQLRTCLANADALCDCSVEQTAAEECRQ